MLSILFTIAAVAFVFCLVVGVHEGGHFIVAKWCGIKAEEFSIGFGPKLFSKQRGGTLYALRMIPAGGFVRLAGMTGLETTTEGADTSRDFNKAKLWKRFITIAAGGLINLLFAALILSVTLMIGSPSQISPSSELPKVGLHDGDTLVSVNNQPIGNDEASNALKLHSILDANQGKAMPIAYTDSSNKLHQASVSPTLFLINYSRTNGLPIYVKVNTINGQPVQGLDVKNLLSQKSTLQITGVDDITNSSASGQVNNSYYDSNSLQPGQASFTWRLGYTFPSDGLPVTQAIYQGFDFIPSATVSTFTSLYQIATDPNSGGLQHNLQGPVGVVKNTAQASQSGWRTYLGWIALLSFNLGLFNLLPIPFLDGGRLMFIVLEAIRRKPVAVKTEMAVHYMGLATLLVLVVYISLADFNIT